MLQKSNPEFPQQETKEKGVVSLEKGEISQELFASWLEVRHNYVRAMGWLDMPSDIDRYDEADSTKHFLALEGGEIKYGMRLSPVDSVEDSLSFEMLSGNPDMQKKVIENFPVSENTWDLTRLIPGEGVGRRDHEEYVAKLFGEGLRATQGQEDPIWVYLIDQRLAKWLGAQGIEINTVAAGQVRDDDPGTYIFGFVNPAEIARTTQGQRFTETAMGRSA